MGGCCSSCCTSHNYLNGQFFNTTSKSITYIVTERMLNLQELQKRKKKTDQTSIGCSAQVKPFKPTDILYAKVHGNVNLNNIENIEQIYQCRQISTAVMMPAGQRCNTGLKNIYYGRSSGRICYKSRTSLLHAWVGTKQNIENQLFSNVQIRHQDQIRLQFYQQKGKVLWKQIKKCK